MRNLTDPERNYVRSLRASALTSTEIAYLLDLLLELDPECGPLPPTSHGKKVAATVYVRLMQATPGVEQAQVLGTWRAGHAR